MNKDSVPGVKRSRRLQVTSDSSEDEQAQVDKNAGAATSTSGLNRLRGPTSSSSQQTMMEADTEVIPIHDLALEDSASETSSLDLMDSQSSRGSSQISPSPSQTKQASRPTPNVKGSKPKATPSSNPSRPPSTSSTTKSTSQQPKPKVKPEPSRPQAQGPTPVPPRKVGGTDIRKKYSKLIDTCRCTYFIFYS